MIYTVQRISVYRYYRCSLIYIHAQIEQFGILSLPKSILQNCWRNIKPGESNKQTHKQTNMYCIGGSSQVG